MFPPGPGPRFPRAHKLIVQVVRFLGWLLIRYLMMNISYTLAVLMSLCPPVLLPSSCSPISGSLPSSCPPVLAHNDHTAHHS
ncbi:hypothetical protein P692DRAFT_2039461 [Suillus brevipes Sb2]|nr:hypothetical protein P692DRAFT_2039461 [Suillus brevipes Sb2]